MDGFEALYERYDVDQAYNNPGGYGAAESAYGDGKYPPDWFERKRAVLDHQDGACGRCGRTDADADRSFEAHHYVPLSEGGGNELENLVALCLDCHGAIHPDVAEADGNWRDAPRYPTADADPRVCFVTKPDPAADLVDRIFLDLLAETSTPGENVHVQSRVTVGLSPTDAKRARTDLASMLANRGFDPDAIAAHADGNADLTAAAGGDRDARAGGYGSLLSPDDLPDDWECSRCGEETPYHRFVSYRVLTYDADERVLLCRDCAAWAIQHTDRRVADVASELRFPVPVDTDAFLRDAGVTRGR